LDVELAKDIVALQGREKFSPTYITQIEYEQYDRAQLKNKIASILIGEYIAGEALRYVVLHLQEHNLDSKKTKELLDGISTYKKIDTYHGKFAIEIHHLLGFVANADLENIYFFDELDNYKKDLVLKNTIAHFTNADRVTLEKEILLDFDISSNLSQKSFKVLRFKKSLINFIRK